MVFYGAHSFDHALFSHTGTELQPLFSTSPTTAIILWFPARTAVTPNSRKCSVKNNGRNAVPRKPRHLPAVFRISSKQTDRFFFASLFFLEGFHLTLPLDAAFDFECALFTEKAGKS